MLRPGDRIFSEDTWTQVNEVMVTGEKPILAFELSNGCTLRCSPDHRLFRDVDGTWKSRGTSALATGGAGTTARDGALGVSVGAQAKGTRVDVTALLDAEQYAAIAAPPDEPLLVLGSAGSGKTTVALHRLARLTAQSEQIPLVRARVVVPEPGLARLAQRLLAPLLPVPGAEDDKGPEVVHTLDEYLMRLARRAFGQLPRVNFEPPALVTAMKSELAPRARSVPPLKLTVPVPLPEAIVNGRTVANTPPSRLTVPLAPVVVPLTLRPRTRLPAPVIDSVPLETVTTPVALLSAYC
jgi:hypothetical protein